MHNIKYQNYTVGHPKSNIPQVPLSNPQPRSTDQVKPLLSSVDEPKHNKEKDTDIDPPPPRDISKENLGLWVGWIYKSDREVVREAASKGAAPLAGKFLSLRKNLPLHQIEEFIKEEVLIWVDELLNRKLILNILRILKNINVDPFHELQNVFYKTANNNLRQYVGNYLKEQNALPTDMEQLWTFLDIIMENTLLVHHSSLTENSIESLDKKSNEWKDNIAAKLFLSTHDNRLVPMVKMEVLWNYLLSTKEVHLLRSWIEIAYSSEPNILNIPENLLLVLKSFPITEEMIKDLGNSNLSEDNFEKIVNDLAKFGVFVESDRVDFLNVLSRIDQADSLVNIYEILGKKDSNLPLFKFTRMLVDYCLEHNLLTVLNACTKNFDMSVVAAQKHSFHLNLMVDFRNLVIDYDEVSLQDNIFNVSLYLSDGDLEKYFCDNPLIFLSLLILNKDVCVEKSMTDKSLVVFGVELYSCLSNVMKHFNLLASAYFRKIHGVKCNLTYFDLLERHVKIDVKKAFAFHFEGTPLPNFSSPELAKYAYSKKVNYTFYLKQCRPSIASKNFLISTLKTSNNIDEAKASTQKKVYKIAVINFKNVPLVASCISFLEIIGIKSEFLRISVKAAKVLSHSGMDVDNIKALLLNVERNPMVIQTLLEGHLIKLIDFGDMHSGNTFIKAVKLYELVVQFSVLYNLPLPESFLRHLTQRNLWFPFLLYAQMKNYPVDQIKEICSNFKNPNLLEHVVHSVMHDIHVDETNVLMRERDSRKYLLSKLGVRRSVEDAPGATGSLRSKSTGSFDSNYSSFGSEILEIDPSNTKVTLLQILIRCHNSTDPPRALLQACQLYRNPLLAILATSYEPDSLIINWLTWLAVSTDLYELFTNFEALTASGQEVTDLLDNCIRNRFPKTLLQSFAIFIPNNPLTPFVDFLNKLISRDHDPQYLTPKLDKFKTLKSSRRASVMSQTDYEMTYLKNKVWIEKTALQLLCSAIIYNSDSHYDHLEFVELLCNIKIDDYFSCEIPNFHRLLKILETMFDTGIRLNIGDYFDSTKEKECVQSCVNELVKESLFDEALKVAQYSDINTDMIVLKKWQNKYEIRKIGIQKFLTECDEDFVARNVAPEYVISFFKERVSVDDLDRYYLLKFSHKWAFTHGLSTRYQLERKKILAFIRVSEKSLELSELTEIDGGDAHMTYKEMIDILETVKRPPECLTTDCLNQLDAMLNESLNRRNFWFALKLERMFGCKSSDLDILRLCHGLAEGLVLPYHLNVEQKQLITRVKEIQRLNYRRRSLSYRSTSISSDKNYLDLIEEDTETTGPASQNTLGLIHSLIEKLHCGSELAYSVFMKYRISCNIDIPYEEIVLNSDHIKMLKDALQDDCINKLEVVHDFLEVYCWSKEDITDFVCDQFVSAASKYSKSKTEDFILWDIKLAEQFHLILNIFKDECSTLGYKFYNYASAVHQEQVTADLNFKISEMSLVVELLIAAHNCFTADCNMEGISTILRKCRTVISHLLTVRSWKLIVRLMTGVGRYTELNFVFHILKENHQFEFLLSKGSKRDEKLKLACVEYLKKYCPQNKDLYKLVALHFTLYSEIGLVWEREAQAYIKNLLAIAKAEMQNNRVNVEAAEFMVLTNSDGTSLLLNKAMENYVHAAEFHMQGEKLTKAMSAAKQAELIALQKSLLKVVANNQTVPCLLNLSNVQVTKLMSKQLNFNQAYILDQAYNCQADWSQVVYEQTVVNNNVEFFDLYDKALGTNEQLIQDISRKFFTSPIKTPHGFRNIKHMIEQLTSVNAKYRLASELGFTGLVSDIIADEDISHLKDTVWKRGYKN